MFWESGELSLLKQFMKLVILLLKYAHLHCRKKVSSSLKIWILLPSCKQNCSKLCIWCQIIRPFYINN